MDGLALAGTTVATAFGTLLVMYFAIRFGAFLFHVQCPRCKIHISSVKVGRASLSFLREDAPETRDNMRYEDSYVCSICWEELKEMGFGTDGTWTAGALVEYLKSTPNFITVLVALAALVVSIVALVR